MPRVPPITGKEDVPAEHHGVVDDVLGVFGRIRGPFSVLLHSPKMAGKLLPMVTFNRDETIVEPNPRFAAILAAVREREGAYVWAAQVARGAAGRRAAGDDRRDQGKGRPVIAAADEADVVTFVRQLMLHQPHRQGRLRPLEGPARRAMAGRADRRWPITTACCAAS